MTKEILQSIPGISTWPVLALLLFFVTFVVIGIWAFFRMDKNYLKHMQELPLDSSKPSKQGE